MVRVLPDQAELYRKAIEEFPQLKTMGYNVDDAIRVAEKMRHSPEQVARIDEAVKAIEEKRAEYKRFCAESREAKVISNIIDRAAYISANYNEERLRCWLDFLIGDKRLQIETSAALLQETVERLTTVQQRLREVLQGPRRVL
jgi:hypothetical protein